MSMQVWKIYSQVLQFMRNFEGRKMKISQTYACVLLYVPLKAAAFDVPS